MTKEELYVESTIKLCESFDNLCNMDPLLIAEFEVISQIINASPESCYEYPFCGPLRRVGRTEIKNLVREFLSSLSPEYLARYKEALRKQKIKFGNYPEGSYFSFDKETCYIDETHTLNDALTLLHEFFHSLNQNKYVYRQSFSDSVSITAELLFLEFLLEKGYSKYDIALVSNRRNYMYAANTHYLKRLFPIYLDAVNGTISDDTYKKTKHLYDDEDDFLEFIHDQTVACKDMEDRLLSYRHTLGFIAASTFHQKHFTKDVLVAANDYLAEGEITSFRKVLGDGIFNDAFPLYVVREMEHFKQKVYEKK